MIPRENISVKRGNLRGHKRADKIVYNVHPKHETAGIGMKTSRAQRGNIN